MSQPTHRQGMRDEPWQDMVPATSAMTGFDPEAVATELLAWSERLVGVEGAVMHIATDSGLKLSWVREADKLPPDAWLIENGHPSPVARACRQARTQIVSDEADLSAPVMSGFRWRSAVCVPLVVDGTVVGVFSAGWRAPFVVTSDVLLVLEAAASLGASLLGRMDLLHRVKQEQHRLRAVIDGLPVAASIIDINTLRVRWHNQHARRLFGSIASATALFAPADPTTTKQENDSLAAKRLSSFLRGEAAPGRTTIRSAEGQWRIVAPSVAQIDDQSAVVIHVDVTQDAHVDQERSRFVRMVSHHLRTPLTPLLGYIPLLADEKTDDTLRQEAVAAMTSSVNHLSHLVARLEQIASLRPIDAAAMGQHRIGDLLEKGWHAATTGQPTLELDGQLEASVHCAQDHVVGAFRELFVNAVTHGTPPVNVSVTVDGDAHIRVSDAGLGISAEWENAIFEPFLSAQEGYLAPEAEHIGLGLNLAKGLIFATGGELSYSNRAFQIRLKSADS